MRNIGLEFCDEGFLAVANDNSGQQFVDLESSSTASPGYVYFDGSRYICGQQAKNRCRIYPRYVSDLAWNQLSLRVSELQINGKTPLYSELAYHHLHHVWKHLDAGPPVSKLVLALPGSYLVGKDGDEEKIGLILGMVQHMKIPLAGMVDMACASVAEEAHRLSISSGEVIHLDIHQRATYITVVEIGAKIRRKHLVSAHVGFAEIFQELTPKLANRFLSQTAFDISHSAESEQQFYNQVQLLFEQLNEQDEGVIEMGGVKRPRKMTVYRDVVAKNLENINEGIVQLVEKARLETSQSGVPLLITSRAELIPGLAEKLAQSHKGEILVLEPGSAACGALQLAENAAVFENLEEAPLTVEFNLEENGFKLGGAGAMPRDPDPQLANGHVPDNSTGEIPAANGLTPTHVVFEGVAHRISSGQFDVGKLVPVSSSGLILVNENGTIVLDNRSGESVHINREPAKQREPLKIGDILTLGENPRSADLLVIHCAQ